VLHFLIEPGTKGKRIFVSFHLLNESRLDRRYRFTLAEELSHYLIHHDIYKDCATIEERLERDKQFTRQELYYFETNAKALASAILMPQSLMESRVKELFSLIGKNSSHTAPIITILSRKFDVSIPAVKRRLKNLGYHKKSDLQLK